MPFGRDRRSVAMLVIVAILLAPLSANRAEAETIILKDGTEIPCRILLESTDEITVRTAGGMEVSYKKKDISRIDRSVSSVEVYEAVAEKISRGNLAAALYLGHWCLANGLENEAKRFFEVASRDRAVAARAYLALAKLTNPASKKRSFLVRSVVADPSLKEAVDALKEMGYTETKLPEDLVVLGSALYSALPNRGAREVLQRLVAVERYPDSSARTEYADRFREFTGLSLSDVRLRCGAGAKAAIAKSPRRNVAADGTCRSCRNSGYTQCPICLGRGYRLCKTCQGSGKSRVRTYNSRSGVRRSETKCPGCRGAGGQDCRSCARLPDGPRRLQRGYSLSIACRTCNGTGRVENRSSTYPNRRTYVSTSTCPSCKGVRTTKETHRVTLTLTSSGKRRCNSCNADGSIALDGGRAPVVNRTRRSTTPTPTPAEESIFGPEERTRLASLAEIFMTARGSANLRWQAGPKVPYGLDRAETSKDSSDEVFAFGQWCTSSMMSLKARTAKALGYKPREVDVSMFETWMRDQELAFLRGKSKLLGRGATDKSCADAVKALVSAIECSRRVGVIGGLEHSTVMRTTFSPGKSSHLRIRSGKGKPPVVCHLGITANALALVLLSDTGSWPAKEVVLEPLPEEKSGFDFQPVMRTVRASPQDLTLYYRVRGLRRETVGRDVEATTRVILPIEILGATCGSLGRPTKYWLRSSIGN
jgi:hypothetical protein